ncbi:hypothetical protein GCM10009775_27830 [Microbacterium aoyamense]|uniref:DUF4190 domain-containing protein n=1 Tax=Microbacterium aoyamense TaxID=344166 RepID=A0ABN2PWF9_9MICO|nr:DUF4190 domain-containing protein [Microbacterium aoyamense]
MTDPNTPPAPDAGSTPPAYTPPPADAAPTAYTPPAAEAPPAYAPPAAAAPAYEAPAYAAAPPAAYGAPATATVPGRTMGIVAFILSFFVQLVALILGIVALVQSRKAGHKNGFALAAIIISAVLLVVGTIILIFVIIGLTAAAGIATEVYTACQAVDFSGVVTVQGVQVDCTSINR